MHNLFGCRSSVPDPTLPNVICIGDSITYGMPFGHVHAFPQVAEGLMDHRVRVINMGCPGFASSKILAHWRRHEAQHSPVLFFVQVPYFDRHHDPRQPYIEDINDDTWLHGIMARRGTLSDADMSHMSNMFLPIAIDELRSLLVHLREIACVHVLMYRYWSAVCKEFDNLKDHYWDKVDETVKSLGLGITDMSDMFTSAQSGITRNEECHLTKQGHIRWARMVKRSCNDYGVYTPI